MTRHEVQLCCLFTAAAVAIGWTSAHGSWGRDKGGRGTGAELASGAGLLVAGPAPIACCDTPAGAGAFEWRGPPRGSSAPAIAARAAPWGVSDLCRCATEGSRGPQPDWAMAVGGHDPPCPWPSGPTRRPGAASELAIARTRRRIPERRVWTANSRHRGAAAPAERRARRAPAAPDRPSAPRGLATACQHQGLGARERRDRVARRRRREGARQPSAGQTAAARAAGPLLLPQAPPSAE